MFDPNKILSSTVERNLKDNGSTYDFLHKLSDEERHKVELHSKKNLSQLEALTVSEQAVKAFEIQLSFLYYARFKHKVVDWDMFAVSDPIAEFSEHVDGKATLTEYSLSSLSLDNFLSQMLPLTSRADFERAVSFTCAFSFEPASIMRGASIIEAPKRDQDFDNWFEETFGSRETLERIYNDEMEDAKRSWFHKESKCAEVTARRMATLSRLYELSNDIKSIYRDLASSREWLLRLERRLMVVRSAYYHIEKVNLALDEGIVKEHFLLREAVGSDNLLAKFPNS